jgi:hypothetical protein
VSGCSDDETPFLDIDVVDPNALPKVRYGSGYDAGSDGASSEASAAVD